MSLPLIKQNIDHIVCAKEIKSLLEKEGFSTDNENKNASMCQFQISINDKNAGFLRFWKKSDGSTTIDDTQIKLGSVKEKIKGLLSGYLNLEAFEMGSIPLGVRQIDLSEISRIKSALLENFPELKDANIKNQVFEYRLEGSNLIVSQYNTGSLAFQGKSTKFSDKVILFIDRLITERQREYLISKIKELVPKEEFENIKQELMKRQINLEEHISKELYTQISGCGAHLLHDGLLIMKIVKENNIKLKDYGSIVRNFAMLFEDFLINWLINIDLLNEESFKQDPTYKYIGQILNQKPNKIEQNFSHLYNRTKPKFLEKLQSAYQECRHDILHADKFKYIPLSLVQAENRLKTMLECMEDCVRFFSKYLLPEGEVVMNFSTNILGTDESGKGDYFGPLVVAGVFVGNKETEIKLRNIGVQDSKNISDTKIRELAKQIYSLCKCDVVTISPERYNQLYSEIQNLNTLLGWGHARVIENMLKNVKPLYVISDKFGDESFIKSKLMSNGKKINLIQEIKAEQNIAVAAASVLARDSFLEYREKLEKYHKCTIPKGAGEDVVAVGKNIVKEKGRDILSKIAKIHFSITQKII